ncbi:DEAD-box ATP-dependent RNA helicase 22, partial [Cucurbita argyrosperma subsp. sororia]
MENRFSELQLFVEDQVFDEADMLLVGSFQNKVIRLINLLRFEEKLLSRSKESPERLMELEADRHPQLTLQDESDIETETISEGEGEGEGKKVTTKMLILTHTGEN